jgi:hypothetical protein
LHEPSLCVHIGLHKTGTSFLQEQVFPHIAGLHLIRGMAPLREELTRDTGGGPILISSELLSGRPWPLLGSGDVQRAGRFASNFRSALRTLARLHPHARVLVGVRRHGGWLASLYRQYLHEGGELPLDRFFAVDGALLGPEDLLLQPRLALIRELFGEPFVFTQAQLRDRRDELLPALVQWLGLPPSALPPLGSGAANVGVQARQAALLRKLNALDARLRALPGHPTTYNRVFKRLGITPRHLCQGALASLPSPPLALPSELDSWMQTHYADDWQAAQAAASLR